MPVDAAATMMPVARPLIVIEGPPEMVERAIGDLVRQGWRVRDGFHPPGAAGRESPAGREIRVGLVRSAEDAAAAMLAVLDGAGVIIHASAPPEVQDRLIGDLRHIGPVDHRRDQGQSEPALEDDARQILAILAQGRTLGEAAAAVGLSRRTADRRLAQARAALGVERTVEAVARARRLGWLG
jgi:DNA-binding CsgD family transcriptional regulator